MSIFDANSVKENAAIYILIVLCLVFGPWSQFGFEYFALDRVAVMRGQIWRLWTGHFVHTNWSHVLLNITGLVLLQLLFSVELKRLGWATVALFLAPIIATAFILGVARVWTDLPSFDYVVGLSGLLHGAFVYAACIAMRRDIMLGLIVLAIVAIKLLSEIIIGPMQFVADIVRLPVAVDMHIYGSAVGLVIGAGCSFLTIRNSV